MDDVPDVAEAVKRLPRQEQDLRSFRLKRACDLTMKQIILPKDQWTKPEEVFVAQSQLFKGWMMVSSE